MKIGYIVCGALLAVFFSGTVHAKDSDQFEPRPLDGVLIEAVEDYPDPQGSQLGVGVGLYPFNAYYSGILFNGNYLHHLGRFWDWEVLNLNYVYSFEKSLTTELAERWQVNPQEIERLNFLVSSNILYTFLNGKFVFGEKFIRYFRTSAIVGIGLMNTSVQSAATGNLGARVEVYTSRSFAWRIDVRDAVNSATLDHMVTFTLGTALSL